MIMKTIRNDDGIFVELSKDQLKFESKEAEIIFDLSLENDFLQQENQELKKQLEKKYEKVGTLTGELLYEENTKLINQQKEFIEWLKQSAKKYTSNVRVNVFDEYGNRIAQYINAKVYEITPEDVVKEVLSKYKEIIGVKDE